MTRSPTPGLRGARSFHSTALLPSGRVLVAGGQGPGGAVLDTAELYDPVSNTWTPAGSLAGARAFHSTALLPSGRVLVAGGQGPGGAVLDTAELYDGTGAQPAWRPVVTGPDEGLRACSIRVTGTGFRGISGASSGDYKDSATNFPLVRLQRPEGGRLWSLPGTDHSDTGVTVPIPASATPGTYVLSVFANAIGGGRMLTVLQNTAPVAQAQTLDVLRDTPVSVTLVATDAEAGALTYVIVTPPANGTLSGTPPALTYTPNPGYEGPDSFTFVARDCGLESPAATVAVNVVSDPPPVLTCPANQTAEAQDASGTVVTYEPAIATDPGGPDPVVTYSPPSGSRLPLGDTTVTVTAVDSTNHQSTCSFQVTVRDTTAPVVSCPEDIRVTLDDAGGTEVTYTLPTATDSVSGPATVTASPESGSRFSRGQTRVTVTATDAAGNSAQCSFEVSVQARVVSIAGGGCQSSGGGANAALVVLSVLAIWAGRRRGRERATP